VRWGYGVSWRPCRALAEAAALPTAPAAGASGAVGRLKLPLSAMAAAGLLPGTLRATAAILQERDALHGDAQART
jgi:hypothetical protein